VPQTLALSISLRVIVMVFFSSGFTMKNGRIACPEGYRNTETRATQVSVIWVIPHHHTAR
jgi:hypothetical protein